MSDTFFVRRVLLKFYRMKINLQIFIDAGSYGIRKGIIPGIFRFEIINENPVFVRINNPVFSYSGGAVFK